MATVPEDQLPPLPTGFRPPLDRSGGGCSRPVLAGCGCLGLLLFGFLLLVQWQQDRLLDWSVDLWERTLLAETDGSLTDAEQARVARAFMRFRSALGAGSVEWETAVEVNRTWTAILAEKGGQPLTFVDILPLIERLEALALADPSDGQAPGGEAVDEGARREVLA